MTIGWDDDRTCEYPLSLLRNACPCAVCQGGHENMSSEPGEDVFTIPVMEAKATLVEDVEAVGNYAIRVIWGDGHRHGIYDWHYLYTLCLQMEARKENPE
jgi:DUF971 family protein